jgi:hypothetical protein
MYPAALWATSLAAEDWERIERLRRAEPFDWRHVFPFRSKEDAGHEAPWLRFLAGENPDYPERILRASLGVAHWRLDRIAADTANLSTVNIHHWQQHNPVTTEALIQLTLGAPSPVYNGGLLHAPLRYFDTQRRRPGLPEDVAALVTHVAAAEVQVHLVNLSVTERREVVLQAGAFREHRFDSVHYETLGDASAYPGGGYTPGHVVPEDRHEPVGEPHVLVALPPRTRISLRLETTRFVNQPACSAPWAVS